jgi:ketopantoate hydroxymethyltransferase
MRNVLLSMILGVVVGIVLVSNKQMIGLDRYSLIKKTQAAETPSSYVFSVTDLPYLSDDEVVNVKNELAVRLSKENKFDKVSFFKEKLAHATEKSVKVYCKQELIKIYKYSLK